MRERLLHHTPGPRTYIVMLDAGEEVLSSLKLFFDREDLGLARFSATGLCTDATLAVPLDASEFTVIDEPLEILSFSGTIARGLDGVVQVDGQCIAQRRRDEVIKGRLMSAHIRSSLKIVLTESVAHAGRRSDLSGSIGP